MRPCNSQMPPTWSMWVCVQTICLAVRPCLVSRARISCASSPGSMMMASRVSSSPRIVQLHSSQPTGNVSMIILSLLYLLRAEHLERPAPRGAAVLEVRAADQLFVSGWKLLADDQFVPLEHPSLIVEVSGFELNLVVGELVAVVFESDDPAGSASGQLRPEFRACDHDIPSGVGAAQHVYDTAAVLPDTQNQDDSHQYEPPRENPLPRPEEL